MEARRPRQELTAPQLELMLAEQLREKPEAVFSRMKIVERLGVERSREIILRIFRERHQLKPAPSMFWEVDRRWDAYHKRYGFSPIKLCEVLRDPKEPQLALELGSGNSNALHHIQQWSPETRGYTALAINDACYYSLATLFKKSIDFDLIERHINAPLDSVDRKLIARLLYITSVVESGHTEEVQPPRDNVVYTSIADDVNNLKLHLPAIAEKLRKAKAFPNIAKAQSSADGAMYPHQIHRESCSIPQQQALRFLEQRLPDALTPKASSGDLIDIIEAYPEHMVIGDFSRVHHLPLESFDIIYGARSTVYVEGQKYINLMHAVAHRIKHDGVYVDDGIRRNFGQRYEVDAWRGIARNLGKDFHVHVVLGPGVQGEDAKAGNMVPMATVVTRNPRLIPFLRTELLFDPHYQLRQLSEI